jgi:hypothetical protein
LLYLITWVGIVTSPTYSFAIDKFKESHEIIVIKIVESLNFVVKIQLKGIFDLWQMNMLVTSQYQPKLSSMTNFSPGRSANQIAVFISN